MMVLYPFQFRINALESMLTPVFRRLNQIRTELTDIELSITLERQKAADLRDERINVCIMNEVNHTFVVEDVSMIRSQRVAIEHLISGIEKEIVKKNRVRQKWMDRLNHSESELVGITIEIGKLKAHQEYLEKKQKSNERMNIRRLEDDMQSLFTNRNCES